MNQHFVYFRCWPGFTSAFPFDCCNHLADDEIEPELLKRFRKMREHDDPVARAVEQRKSQAAARPTARHWLTGARLPRLPMPPEAEQRQATPQEEILQVAKAAGWTKVPFFRFFRYEGFENCLWSERRYVHCTANSQSAKNLARQLRRSFSDNEIGPRFGFVAASDFECALQTNIEVLVGDLRTESASFWGEDDPLLPFAKMVAAVADKLSPLGAEGKQAILGSSFDDLEDPVKCVWVARQIGNAAGRPDALPRRFKSRNYPIVKRGNVNYCQRKDAMVMFPSLKHRLMAQPDTKA